MNAPGSMPRAEAAQYAAWFRALADPTRVQIMSLLAWHGLPMKVGEIVTAMHVSQSTVSQHLRVLARARFVLAERRGTAAFYRLNEACVDRFPTAAALLAGSRPGPATARHQAAAGGRDTGAHPPGVTIRPLVPADADRVLAIYQAGLDTGNASFETTAPSWAVFDATKLPGHRHVAVAEGTGEVLGWVAACPVSERCVYAGVVEHSVYVDPAARGSGVGAALLRALIDSTESAGIWTIQSGIFPENATSLRLHRQAGFREVGIRERIGRHHGGWRDVVLLERRSARAGPDTPAVP